MEESGRLPGSHARAQPRFLDDKGCSFPGLHTGFQWSPADHAAGAICDKGEAGGGGELSRSQGALTRGSSMPPRARQGVVAIHRVHSRVDSFRSALLARNAESTFQDRSLYLFARPDCPRTLPPESEVPRN